MFDWSNCRGVAQAELQADSCQSSTATDVKPLKIMYSLVYNDGIMPAMVKLILASRAMFTFTASKEGMLNVFSFIPRHWQEASARHRLLWNPVSLSAQVSATGTTGTIGWSEKRFKLAWFLVLIPSLPGSETLKNYISLSDNSQSLWVKIYICLKYQFTAVQASL